MTKSPLIFGAHSNYICSTVMHKRYWAVVSGSRLVRTLCLSFKFPTHFWKQTSTQESGMKCLVYWGETELWVAFLSFSLSFPNKTLGERQTDTGRNNLIRRLSPRICQLEIYFFQTGFLFQISGKRKEVIINHNK